jgi:hypothetical protein
MRGLISAALVLAPALASALVVPEVDLEHEVTPIGNHFVFFCQRMPS